MRLCTGLLAAIVAVTSASAQTYTPKIIKLQGAGGMDQTSLMRLLDLPSGAVTKAQIDAALQRLGDSGLFSEIRYTVNPDALVFILKPAPGAQALPVRFTNFVWWKPQELETLLEQRVPLYTGKLSLNSSLTEQVKAALVALLADKGIYNAQISTRLSTISGSGSAANAGVNGIAVSLDQPQILLKKLQLTGTAPEVAGQMQIVEDQLSSQDFDQLLTARQIVENSEDTHRNAGYLDVVVKEPLFSEPYKETVGYGIDASAMVYPGARYHVASISFEGLPPDLESPVEKAAGIKAGDPAGEMTLRIAQGSALRVLQNRGMLDAAATTSLTKDPVTHTVAYRVQMVPGPTYTFAGVDLSALTVAQQALFQHSFHVKPGAVANEPVRVEMNFSLRAAGVNGAVLNEHKDRATHTVVYAITPRSRAQDSASAPQGL